MSKPTVFISYSHLDEEWKDRLVRHLAVSQKQGHLELWHDRKIGAGEDWEQQIQAAMDAASVAILLVSANSLTSDFILREEVSRLLERRASEGLRIFPVVIKPCDWGAVDWLRRMNLRPTDGKPLSGGTDYQIDLALTEIAKEVRQLLTSARTTPAPPTFVPLPPEKISIFRLPVTGPDLFGREAELKLLDDAWADPSTNIVAFVAWGGVGKSALVNTWLARMAKDQYRGAERVFAWSFYSQGTSDERAASADLFIDAALRWFGDEDPTAGSPWDKGERLANLIRRTRTLLALDGLEPLQHPPGPQEGKLKDQALQSLLRELAAQQRGLCVVSTRLKISDLEGFAHSTVRQEDLDQLPPQAGAQILRAQRVAGDDDELEAASAEFGGHSLALTLLGSYLADVCGGDIRRRGEIGNLEEDERHGGHARRVMAAYEKWLSIDGKGGPELAVLRLLGLFDRPAPADAIAVLRAAPVIPGLTDALFRSEQQKRWFGLSATKKAEPLSQDDWRRAVSKLRRIKLLAEPDARAPADFSLSPVAGQTKVRPTVSDELDAHPLVREHFRQQLQRHHPDAWRAANLRLYEHLIATTKELPDTVEEMSPLYAAVAHGCAAGRHQQALEDVYWRRILRGKEAFSLHKLGAFGADLAALAGFFETPWRRPAPGLTEGDQAFVLNQAGADLRALGRLQEAVEPMQAGLQARISQEDWKNAAKSAGNLSELYLTIGDPPQALTIARQSVELADRSGDEFMRMYNRTTLADALHQAGQAEEAEAAFRQAEEMQKQRQPEYPILYSLQGFQYCDLLLGQGKHQEVKERAARTIEIAKRNNWLLDIALDNLSLGRACLLQSGGAGAGDYGQAAEFLQRAVDGLRQAGYLYYLPLGLLARAELRRVTGDGISLARARADLDEAQRIAERGGMGLHLADCHLEWARLCLATGERDQARVHWATAKAMIEEMGYHRRDGEVVEIEQQLNAD